MSTPGHRTVAGSSYLVTTKCWQGSAVFRVTETAEILLDALLQLPRFRRIFAIRTIGRQKRIILKPPPPEEKEKPNAAGKDA